MAQALETLRLLIAPGRSSRARTSQCSRVSRRKPRVLGPENERQRPLQPRRRQRRRTLRVQPDTPVAEIAELSHGAGEVGDRADRHMLVPAGGRLGECAGELGRVALGRHQRVDGEGGAGSEDRADVVRVGDLIERDDQAVRRQLGNVDWRAAASSSSP